MTNPLPYAVRTRVALTGVNRDTVVTGLGVAELLGLTGIEALGVPACELDLIAVGSPLVILVLDGAAVPARELVCV